MDWQNDEFESFLRKFRLREARPLTLEHPSSSPRYRVKIAAAAALIFAIGASAAIVRQLTLKKEAPAAVPTAPEAFTGPVAVTPAPPLPPVPQPQTPSVKMDPKAKDPLLQLTKVIPPPPVLQDEGPLSKQEPLPLQIEFTNAFKGGEDEQRKLFNNACGSCHAVNVVENTSYQTRQEYAAMVDRMAAIGAAVSPQEASAIVDYIFRTYGRKAPATDEPGRSVFSTACGTCHAADLVDGRRGADRETFRTIVNNMIGYGASVPTDQVESLVDFLFKTYGRRLR